MEKLFHPSLKESKLCDPEPEMVEIAAVIFHDIGWLTQQGSFDEAMERLRWWVENEPEVFLKVCATGSRVCLNTLKQTVPEHSSCILPYRLGNCHNGRNR